MSLLARDVVGEVEAYGIQRLPMVLETICRADLEIFRLRESRWSATHPYVKRVDSVEANTAEEQES